jgi:hypothetical protein
MQQIADWLEKLGMSEYAQRFAENGISVAALRHLTDQDLKDIGVLLGHRRQMLAAMRGPSGASPLASKTAPTGEAKAQDTAERRQVTVMFSDLVGSTAGDLPLIPVGGIDERSFASWLAAGAAGFGIGSALYEPGTSADALRARARDLFAALNRASQA